LIQNWYSKTNEKLGKSKKKGLDFFNIYEKEGLINI